MTTTVSSYSNIPNYINSCNINSLNPNTFYNVYLYSVNDSNIISNYITYSTTCTLATVSLSNLPVNNYLVNGTGFSINIKPNDNTNSNSYTTVNTRVYDSSNLLKFNNIGINLTTCSQPITGLLPNQTYITNVFPINKLFVENTSNFASNISVTLPILNNFNITNTTTSNFNLAWTPAGSIPTYFYSKIIYTDGFTSTNSSNIYNSSNTFITSSNLYANTYYNFSITPYNTINVSNISSNIVGCTLAYVRLISSNITPTNIVYNWQNSYSIQPNNPIYNSLSITYNSTTYNFSPSDTSFDLGNILYPNTPYTFSFNAYNQTSVPNLIYTLTNYTLPYISFANITNTTSNAISIQWDDPSTLYYNYVISSWNTSNSSNQYSSTYTLNNLIPNTPYTITSVPYNTINIQGASILSYTVTLPTVSILPITNISSNSLVINWNPAGNPPTFNKLIASSIAGDTTYIPNTQNSYFINSNILPNTVYNYTITPYNTAYVTGSSKFVTATTLPYVATLQYTNISTNAITLSWISAGLLNPTYYYILPSYSNYARNTFSNINTKQYYSSNIYTATGLEPNTTYKFFISSYNLFNTPGNIVNTSNLVTLPSFVFQSITNITTNTATLSWNPPGSPPTYSNVLISWSTSNNLYISNKNTSYSFNNLLPNTVYDFNVFPINSNIVKGTGVLNSICTYSSFLLNILPTYSSYNNFTISWSSYNINKPTFQYIDIYYYSTTTFNAFYISPIPNTITSCNLTQYIIPNDTLILTALSYNIYNINDGPLTNGGQQMYVYTLPYITIDPNTSNQITNLATTSLTVNWQNYGSYPSLDYANIQWSSGNIFVYSNPLNYNVTNLLPNTAYQFSINSYNFNGTYGNTVNTNTVYTLPSLSYFNVSNTSNTSITFNWTPVGNPNLYSYNKISWNNNTTDTISNTVNSYSISNLYSNSNYTFTITPYNPNSNAGTSLFVTTTTLPSIAFSNIVDNTSNAFYYAVNTINLSNINPPGNTQSYSSVLLSWSAPYFNGNGSYAPILLTNSNPSFTTSNLYQGLNYTFTALPYNSLNVAGSPISYSITTRMYTVLTYQPTPITNLSTNSLTINWNTSGTNDNLWITAQVSIINNSLSSNSNVLFEYPVGSLGGNSFNINTSNYGNGLYNAIASSSANAPYLAFDKKNTTYWSIPLAPAVYNTVSGTYIGSSNITINSITCTGEWLQINTPLPISLTAYALQCRSDTNLLHPYSWYIIASNDNSTWNIIDTKTNITCSIAGILNTYYIYSSVAYSYYRVIVNSIQPSNNTGQLSIGDFYLYTSTLTNLTSTSQNITNLIGNTNYTIYTSPVSPAGNGSPAITTITTQTYVSFTYLPVITPMTSTSFTVSWNASGTNNNYWSYVNLIITRNSDSAVINNLVINTTNYTITGLTANTTYTISLTAIDNNNNYNTTPITTTFTTNSISYQFDNLSSTAFLNGRGIYSGYRLFGAYNGPTMKIQRGIDNAVLDFYADQNGNLGSAVNATGTSYSSWIVGTAYIITLYDQSGKGYNATQTAGASCPAYSYGGKTWGSLLSLFFNLPTGTIPMNMTYSYIVRHAGIQNANSALLGGGGTTQNTANNFRVANTTTSAYTNSWISNDFGIYGPYTGSNVISWVFGSNQGYSYNTTADTTVLYSNGNTITSGYRSGWAGVSGNEYLMRDSVNNYLRGALYYSCLFSIALSPSDRTVVESLYSFINFTPATNITSSSITLNWNANTYNTVTITWNSGANTSGTITNPTNTYTANTAISPNTQYTFTAVPSSLYNSLKTGNTNYVIYSGATVSFGGTPITNITGNTATVNFTTGTYTKMNLSWTSTVTSGSYSNITSLTSSNLTGLAGNTLYTVNLTPFNFSSLMGSVVSTSFTTLATVTLATSAITDLTTNSFTINWNLNGSYTTYDSIIVFWNDGTNYYSSSSIPSSTNFYNITSLTTNTAYTITLTPYISGVPGQNTVTNTITLPAVSFTGTPITNLAGNSLTVNWINTDYNTVNLYWTGSVGSSNISNINTSISSYNITGLTGSTSYTITLYPYNANNVVGQTISYAITTLPAIIFANTAITGIGTTSFTVNFTGAGYTTYYVAWTGTNGNNNNQSSGTSYNVTNLGANTADLITVTPYTGAISGNSISTTGYTLAFLSSASVSGTDGVFLTIVFSGSLSSVIITWTGNVSGNSGYITTSPYNITGLYGLQTYNISVRAYNSQNVGNNTISFNGTTNANVRGITYSSTSNSITMNWSLTGEFSYIRSSLNDLYLSPIVSPPTASYTWQSPTPIAANTTYTVKLFAYNASNNIGNYYIYSITTTA